MFSKNSEPSNHPSIQYTTHRSVLYINPYLCVAQYRSGESGETRVIHRHPLAILVFKQFNGINKLII